MPTMMIGPSRPPLRAATPGLDPAPPVASVARGRERCGRLAVPWGWALQLVIEGLLAVLVASSRLE